MLPLLASASNASMAFVLREKTTRLQMLAVASCLVGLFLICQKPSPVSSPHADDGQTGRGSPRRFSCNLPENGIHFSAVAAIQRPRPSP